MRRLAELYGVPVKHHVLDQHLDAPPSRVQLLIGRSCLAKAHFVKDRDTLHVTDGQLRYIRGESPETTKRPNIGLSEIYPRWTAKLNASTINRL